MKPRMWTGLVLLATASCGAEPRYESSHVVRDSAGVRLVESYEPVWQPGSVRIEPAPLLDIGREGAGPYQFSVVPSGVLLPSGSIAVTEIRSQEVRVFDMEGSHLFTVGGRGDGPTEFQNLAGIFRYRGDSLAAPDGRRRRTLIFPAAGGTPRVVPHGVEGNFYVFGVLANGDLLLYDPGAGYRPDLEPGLQWTTTRIVAIDPEDGSARVLGELRSREQMVLPDGNTGTVIPPRWATQAVSDAGFYWATPEKYEIRFYDSSGRLERALRRPVEPRTVEPAMVEAFIESRLEWVRRNEGEAAIPRYRERYEEATYGDHLPLFGPAFVDADQRLWLSGSTWPESAPSASEWSVFSAEGAWLGDLTAPEGLTLLDSRGDRVLGVWRDELDVPRIRVHQLVGAR